MGNVREHQRDGLTSLFSGSALKMNPKSLRKKSTKRISQQVKFGPISKDVGGKISNFLGSEIVHHSVTFSANTVVLMLMLLMCPVAHVRSFPREAFCPCWDRRSFFKVCPCLGV